MTTTLARDLPLVEIEWLDSGLSVHTEWQPLNQFLDNHLATVRTAGYLLAETDDEYHVIGTYDPVEESGFSLTVISKKNAKRFTLLKRGRKT